MAELIAASRHVRLHASAMQMRLRPGGGSPQPDQAKWSQLLRLLEFAWEGPELCATCSKAINLCIKLKIARNGFNLLRCLISSLRSFYTVNEVHKFQYSKPVRKGEKDPDNEFAVIAIYLFLFIFNHQELGSLCI